MWTRGFKRLLATRLVSQLGDGMLSAGVTWLTLLAPDAQRTPGAFLGVLALLLLPFSLVGPFVGIALDRWPRRQILLLGELLRAALVVLIAAIIGFGSERASVVVYVLVLSSLGVNRLLLAALSSGVPHVVDRRHLVDANAVAPTSGTLASACGAAIGATVIAIGAPSWLVLLLTAAAFCAASGLASRFARLDLGPDTGTRVPRPRDVLMDLRAALLHLRRRSAAAWALARIGAFRVVLGAWTLAAFTQTAGQGDNAKGVLVAAVTAAGYASAAATAPLAARRFGLPWWVPRLIAVTGAIALAAFGLEGVSTLLVQGFVLGLGGQTLKIQTDTIVQGTVDETFLGRSFTIYDVVFNVGTLLGAISCVAVFY